LQAAKVLLDQGIKVRDQVDLEQRLAALEATEAARQAGEKR
jgi:hypothetical protein